MDIAGDGCGIRGTCRLGIVLSAALENGFFGAVLIGGAVGVGIRAVMVARLEQKSPYRVLRQLGISKARYR